MFDPKSILSVRVITAVVFLVAWNAGLFFARFLGAPFTRSGLIAGGLVAFGTAVCAVAIVKSQRFRQFTLQPSRIHMYKPGIFLFIALITGLIGVGWVAAGFLGLFSDLQPPAN